MNAAPGDRWPFEHCTKCERRIVISFAVDHDVWHAVAEDYPRLCTTCFDELADAKDVAYTFRQIHVATWNSVWPVLDDPCAECAGRRSREQHYRKRLETGWRPDNRAG